MRNVLTSKLPKKKEEEEEKYHLDYIGEDGYVYKHNGEKYYKTGIFLQGPKGLPGVKGKDGLIPRIGKNGNWFIGDTDTFVKAELDTSLYATKKDLDDLIDNAPEVLNTLKELANAIGDDADFATNVNNRLTDIENVAYQVPVGGIPENDLSQGVKDKMNEKEVFWATYGTTTAAEIDAAVAAGKMVCSIYNNQYCPLVHITNDYYAFISVNRSNGILRLDLNRSTSVWSVGSFPLELASRKVTSFQTTPDNTHYPSEKLVKDSLDAKAGIGDILFANFSRLTPKKTFEYDVSDTSYHPLFSRANTGISQLMSEVDDIVKFRITVTGTNIYARVDVVVRFQPSLYYPSIMAWNDTFDIAVASSGIYYLRGIYPKNRNNGYDWVLEFSCYNTTARHIKVEIYEDTENITWTEEKVDTGYNATYQAYGILLIRERRGLCANLNWYLIESQVGSANSASFLNTSLSTWLSGIPPMAGEALVGNQLVIMSGQKVYKATNNAMPIDCDCGVMVIASNYAQGGGISYVAIHQKQSLTTLTADPALTFDTFARGDQVYLRCTLGQDGKIYPDGHLSNVKSAGYTWVHIGTAASATAINLDTCGKPFITLNNDGKVTHINGTAVMDSSMSKWGVVSQTQNWANDYGSYTLSDVTYGYIPKEFIDRWLILVDVFGTFNESTGYFELNGLTDLCYKDAIRISNNYTINLSTEGWRPNSASYSEHEKFKARTTIPCSPVGGSTYPALTHNKYLEVVKFAFNDSTYSHIIFSSFVQYGCVCLRRLLDKISTSSANTLTNWYALEECYFILKANLTASQSKYLSIESILYMINNVAVTTAITITLHPTAYARAIADSGVQAALQAHTNVSLASAT